MLQNMGAVGVAEHPTMVYPSFGYLYPQDTRELRKVRNDTTIRVVLEPYFRYLQIFDEAKQCFETEAGVPDCAATG